MLNVMMGKMNKITWEQAQAMCNEHEDHVTSFMRGYNRAVEDAQPVTDTPAGELGRAVSAWKDLNDRMDAVERRLSRAVLRGDAVVIGNVKTVSYQFRPGIIKITGTIE